MANYTPYPEDTYMQRIGKMDEETMRRIRMSSLGAGTAALGAAGTVASMNPFGGLLAIGGAAYPGRAEAPMEPSGPVLTNEQMWELAGLDAADSQGRPPIIIEREAGSVRPFLSKLGSEMSGQYKQLWDDSQTRQLLEYLGIAPALERGPWPPGFTKKKKKKKKRKQ